MSNRRGYWLRLFRGSVLYGHIVTHSPGGPGPPDPERARLGIHSHMNGRGERRAKRVRSSARLDRPLRWHILQSNTAPTPERVARLGHLPQERWMVL